MITPYRFYTTLQVRFNETDLQGHVNFAWYLNYFDVALVNYLRALDYSYQQMLSDGFDMVYVDAHATYHASAYFDDNLRVHCRVGRIGNTSMRFDFHVLAESDERLIATGEITVVMIERDTQEKIAVPGRIRQAIRAYEGSAVEDFLEANTG